MERLTRCYPDGAIVLNCSENKAIARLAAYEDTGMEPEEITHLGQETVNLKKEYDHYAVAEQMGRLVVLPCKVGDTVWVFGTVEGSDPTPWNVRHVGVTAENPGFGIELSFNSFGKTWFLTREAAEAALAERCEKPERGRE